MNYKSYISSTNWSANPARLAELKAAGFRCRTCNDGRDQAQLEVHHRTYERLGHEHVGDLTTLCSECHRDITDSLRRRRYAGNTLTTLDHRSVSEGFAGLAEMLDLGGRP
jgi:5-methylcytosine-specific restriction endonuclease McrA